MNTQFLRVICFGMLFAMLVFSGCSSGPPKTIVTGRLTYKGEPLKVKPMVGKVFLKFYLDGAPPSDVRNAKLDDDGSFEIKGEGSGIPHGTYKICVEWYEEYSLMPGTDKQRADKLKGQFNEKNSKILRKVPEDGFLELDVSKPGG